MCFNLSRHFLLTCCALTLLASLFAACGATRNPVKTSASPSLAHEFSSSIVAGKEITVPSGQAVVMYSDHLPQAGGSGDQTVSKVEMKNRLKNLASSPPFKKIPAIWGLINHCTYMIYVDVYYVGILHLTVIDAKMAHQIIAKWRIENHVANHYTSENEIPCLTA